jgi:hypothetical protein
LDGWIELIAFAVSGHYTGVDKFSQTGANCGGAQAAEFAQLLDGDGLIQAGKDLLDALESRRFRTGLLSARVRDDRESQR